MLWTDGLYGLFPLQLSSNKHVILFDCNDVSSLYILRILPRFSVVSDSAY